MAVGADRGAAEVVDPILDGQPDRIADLIDPGLLPEASG